MKPRTVVLLGAGASYGSEPSSHPAPPLTLDLFDQLVEQSSIARSIDPELKRLFRNDFERGMSEYYDGGKQSVMGLQRDLAKFLFDFTPSKDNLYRKLVLKLGIRDVVYSSLNYDMLLERSLPRPGLVIDYGLGLRPDRIDILKIHGSVNFWPEMFGSRFHDAVFRGNGVDIEAPIKVLSYYETQRAICRATVNISCDCDS